MAGEIGLVSCFEPDSGVIDIEKGTERYQQSPHLGHRSPSWRRRRSLVDYLESGVWDEKVKRRWWIGIGVASGIVLIVIVGVLAALLAKKQAANEGEYLKTSSEGVVAHQ